MTIVKSQELQIHKSNLGLRKSPEPKLSFEILSPNLKISLQTKFNNFVCSTMIRAYIWGLEVTQR
jgi:hypothetical protein